MNKGHLEAFVAITPLSILNASFDKPYKIHSLMTRGYSRVSDKEYPYLNGIPSYWNFYIQLCKTGSR